MTHSDYDGDTSTWRKLCPEGRDIFYEGNEPEKFAAEMLAEFGFDPSDNPGWGRHFPADETCPAFYSYPFHCPAEHLDAVYGSDRWELGS